MSVGAYLIGLASVAIVTIAAILAGRMLTHRLLPSACGALAGIATAVGAMTTLLVMAELLGTIGQLRRAALVPLALVVGAASALLRRRGSTAARNAPAAPAQVRRAPSPQAVIATACVVVVAAQALLAIRDSAATGILHIDALEYHLSTAAHFASTHSTRTYLHVSFGDDVPYYPFNAELVHAIGMVTLGRDSLSLVLTSIDIGLLLLAAYALGAEYDAGPVALCAVTSLVAVLGGFDASALNDWASIWPFVAGIAVAVHARRHGSGLTLRAAALSGLGFGLAAGTKLDLLGPAILAGIAVFSLADRRLLALGVVAGTGLVGGGYWYVRDVILVGSPIPSSHLPGLHQIPTSSFDRYGYTVAHYLTNLHVWRAYFRPGFHQFFGDAWVPLLVAGLIGMVAGFRPRGETELRIFGAVAILSVGVYAVTPSSALGLEGMPSGFGINLRYALPAVVLGSLLFTLPLRARRVAAATALGFLVCLLITVTDAATWASPDRRSRLEAIAFALVITGVALHPVVRDHRRAAAAVAVLGLAISGYPLQQHYLRDRYATTATPPEALINALPAGSGLRIGVLGRPVEYPFFGPQWHNSVSYVAQPLASHAFELFTDCAAWRQAAGRYDYLVLATYGDYTTSARRWTATDPHAHVVFHNAAGAIFAVSPGFATAPCRAGE
jgi:hypothetical protein